MTERNQVKLKTNIPETITFKYNKPKSGTGEYGIWYLYGVTHDDKDSALFATPLQHDFFQWIGIKANWTGKLTICEGTENTKYYTFEKDDTLYDSRDMKDNPQPKKQAQPVQSQSSSPSNKVTLDDHVNTMAACFQKISAKLEGLNDDALQKMAVSLYITATRSDLYVLAEPVQVEDEIPTGQEPPPDDLPF